MDDYVPGAPAGARLVPPKKAKPADPLIASAAAIRDAYVQERARWEVLRGGDGYRPPKSYDGRKARGPEEPAKESVWLRLARWLQGQSIAPVEYVRFQFSFLPESGHVPEPLQLKASWRVEKFRKDYRSEDRLEALQLAWRVQAQSLSDAIVAAKVMHRLTAEQAACSVLGSSTVDASPLVRYCVAASMKPRTEAVQRIMKLYSAKAVRQLRADLATYRQWPEAERWVTPKLWRRAEGLS